MKRKPANAGKWKSLFILALMLFVFTSCQSESMNDVGIYNLTGIVEGSEGTITGFTKGVNDNLMFGYMGLMILLTVWFMAFITFFMNTGSGMLSLAGASYGGFIIGILLLSMEILAPVFVFAMLIMSGVFTMLIRD